MATTATNRLPCISNTRCCARWVLKVGSSTDVGQFPQFREGVATFGHGLVGLAVAGVTATGCGEAGEDDAVDTTFDTVGLAGRTVVSASDVAGCFYCANRAVMYSSMVGSWFSRVVSAAEGSIDMVSRTCAPGSVRFPPAGS